MQPDHPKFDKLIQTANELNVKIEKDLEKFYGQAEMQAAAKADQQKQEEQDLQQQKPEQGQEEAQTESTGRPS